MEIVTTKEAVRAAVREWRRQGESVGLVPTMGYLHAGHASLMRRARAENGRVVASVFVNPMQFGPAEDLDSYPRDPERDAALCAEMGVDLLFRPDPAEMYGRDFRSYVDVSGLTEGLCGRSRPVHFRGVCTVVCKLMGIVRPDRAYFGQKDAQQLAVVHRMAEDLDLGVQVVGCPIVREPDGLAMSSRNTYLSAEERQAALVLSRAVRHGRELAESGERDAAAVAGAMRAIIEREPLARVDYVEVVDARTIRPQTELKRPVLGAVAVFIGRTRLIDNFILE